MYSIYKTTPRYPHCLSINILTELKGQVGEGDQENEIGFNQLSTLAKQVLKTTTQSKIEVYDGRPRRWHTVDISSSDWCSNVYRLNRETFTTLRKELRNKTGVPFNHLDQAAQLIIKSYLTDLDIQYFDVPYNKFNQPYLELDFDIEWEEDTSELTYRMDSNCYCDPDSIKTFDDLASEGCFVKLTPEQFKVIKTLLLLRKHGVESFKDINAGIIRASETTPRSFCLFFHHASNDRVMYGYNPKEYFGENPTSDGYRILHFHELKEILLRIPGAGLNFPCSPAQQDQLLKAMKDNPICPKNPFVTGGYTHLRWWKSNPTHPRFTQGRLNPADKGGWLGHFREALAIVKALPVLKG